MNKIVEARSTKYEVRNTKYGMRNMRTAVSFLLSPISYLLLFLPFLFSCNIYKFNEATVPVNVKTIKISFIENRARYVNPQLSPQLTDRFQTKVVNQTKLTRTNSDDAHYQVSGYISDYSVSTSGISNQQAATQRLTVTVHLTLKDIVNDKTEEFDVSRNFDFSARLSLQQAESSLNEEIVRNLSDEIFNRVFAKQW
jgi:ribosomal protein S17E